MLYPDAEPPTRAWPAAAGAKTPPLSFDWGALTRDLLVRILSRLRETSAFSGPGGTEELAGPLQERSHQELATLAERLLDRPPAERHMPFLAPILVDEWIQKDAPPESLERLSSLLYARLPKAGRPPPPAGREQMVSFIAERRRTGRFRKDLRREFMRAHRVRGRRRSPQRRPDALPQPLYLQGRGERRSYEPYDHQLEAIQDIERLVEGPDGGGILVVLPTGAGKTDVAVEWALDRLERDERRRLLWLAHRQELLDQAALRFRQLAACRPPSFRRNGRVIHSEAFPVSVLADPEQHVALATWQSLVAGTAAKKKRAQLDSFLSRPTIVVVDEAHRAGAPRYVELLDDIEADPDTEVLIGLTATPVPLSDEAAAWVAGRFPRRVGRVTREQLIAEEILARPTVNVVRTGVRVELTTEELGVAARGKDVPASVLARLGSADRNRLVVDVWRGNPEGWGKSLVFAPTIEAADELAASLQAAGAPCKVLHSRSDEPRAQVIEWFRGQGGGARVLVSVAMLTEGVDLPDARTAFLARPTASHVLMNQMVGRVLRGPRAGGDSEAHLVVFADDWPNYDRVLLDPRWFVDHDIDELEEPPEAAEEEPDTEDVPEEVVAELEALLAEPSELGEPEGDQPESPGVEALLAWEVEPAELVGYYEVRRGHEERTVPVFAGQQEDYERRFAAVLSGAGPERAVELLADARRPLPGPDTLRALAESVAADRRPPILRELMPVSLGPAAVALRIRDAGPLTEEERAGVVRRAFERLDGRLFSSLDAFEEAVERALRGLRRASPERGLPDSSEARSPLPRDPDRDLGPLRDRVVAVARELLAEEPEIAVLDPPTSSGPIGSSGTSWAATR